MPALLTWRGSLLPNAELYNVVSPPRPTAMRAFVYRFLHLPSYHGGLIQSLYSSLGLSKGVLTASHVSSFMRERYHVGRRGVVDRWAHCAHRRPSMRQPFPARLGLLTRP